MQLIYHIINCKSINYHITAKKEDNKININTCTKSDLMKLSGIGSTKAQAIINYRDKNGKFKKIEDLLKVNGIGEALLLQIKEYITV